MTRPNPASPNRRPSASEARLAASLSGAVDLSGLKDRAEAQRRAPAGPAGGPRGDAPGRPGAGVEGAGRASSAVRVDVAEHTFEAEVLSRSMQVPVLVELGSSRAPTAMTATLDRLAAEDGGRWVHAYVDVDSAPGIAQAFQARAVPMVIAVAGGRPLTDFEGEQPEDQLRLVIDKILEVTAGTLEGPGDLPTEDGAEEPADPERDAAENALAEGDLAVAEERFRALVEARKGDHGLVEALRFVEVSRRVAEANDPDAEGRSPEVAAALADADVKVMAGSYAEAFEALVAAIRTTFGEEREVLRTRLLALLDTLPANDADVLAARRNLATALY